MTAPVELEPIEVSVPPSVPNLEQFLALVKRQNLARQERFFVTPGHIPPGVPNDYARDLTLLCEEAAIPGVNIGTRTLRVNGLNEQRAHTLDYMGDSITLQFLIDRDFKARTYFQAWMEQCVSHATRGREVGYYEDYAKKVSLYAVMPAGLPGEALVNWSPTQADTGLKRGIENFTNTNPSSKVGMALGKVLNNGKNVLDRTFARAKQQTIGRLNLASNPIVEAFRQPESVVYSVELHECWPRSINVMPMSYSNPGVHRMNVTFTYKYYIAKATLEETWDEKLASQATTKVSDFLQKQTEKIPAGGLQKLGTDLKNKFGSLTRKNG